MSRTTNTESKIITLWREFNGSAKTIKNLRYLLIKTFRLLVLVPLLKKYIGPYLVLFALHFYPEFIGSFTRIFSRLETIGFVNNKNKPVRTDDPMDDFHVITKNINRFDEVNLILRGPSIKNNISKINRSLPTFIVDENYVVRDSEFFIYIAADIYKFNSMKRKSLSPVIFIGTHSYKSDFIMHDQYGFKDRICVDANTPEIFVSYNNTSNAKLTSGVISIVALSKISNKINIYGWDNYLDNDISKMSYRQALFFLIDSPIDRHGARRYSKLGACFDKMIGINYCARFLSDKKYNIVSYQSGLLTHKKLINKIERAYYN